ncbi:unnamed protein product [Penicillium salamii]|nr:unnamed protein product [Penicillium salamii]
MPYSTSLLFHLLGELRVNHPLSKIARDVLIDRYCPAASRTVVSANPASRDCLVRLYLGRRRFTDVAAPNLTLRNFNLHVDSIIELDFLIEGLASSNGEALAVLHWCANTDGYDLEFVLALRLSPFRLSPLRRLLLAAPLEPKIYPRW